MPLDTGSVTPDLHSVREVRNDDVSPEVTPSVDQLAFSEGTPFGAGLKAVREFKGLSLQDIADATRVRRQYLAAIEAMDMAQLPSRPFAIGYVRAYARVLGLDEDRAVARFKTDAPDPDVSLRAPVGMANEGDPRLALIAIAGAVVLGAIIIWNVAQRSMADRAPPPPPPIQQAAVAPVPPTGPVALGDALPPPVESTIPQPYNPPGLYADDGDVTGDPTKTGPSAALPEAPLTNPKAQVFGAPADQSAVSLRARRPVTLVVRSAGAEAPVFGRVLSTGETYRAPLTPGLTLDVSDPTAVDVFSHGQFIGQLPALATPLSRLGG